jgi:hypothetical protein
MTHVAKATACDAAWFALHGKKTHARLAPGEPAKYSLSDRCFLYEAALRDPTFPYCIDPSGGKPWRWVRRCDEKVICEGAELYFVPMTLPREQFVLAVIHAGPQSLGRKLDGKPYIEAATYSLSDIEGPVIDALGKNGVVVFDRDELASLMAHAVFGLEQSATEPCRKLLSPNDSAEMVAETLKQKEPR